MKTLTELITPLLKVMPSPVPRRQQRLRGQHALADGIKYVMPVNSDDSPVLMAAFPINKKAATAILPGPELRPFSLGGKGLLVKSERELNTALKQARKTARSGKAVLVNILIGKTDFRKGSLSM